MLTAGCDLSLSLFTRSPLQLRDESSSSNAFLETQPFDLNLPYVDLDDQEPLSKEAAIPPRELDRFSSTSTNKTLILPGESNDDTDDGTSDDSSMESSKSSLRSYQEPLKIIEPTGVGAGLLNLGNTCFINSVLQCFTHTVPLLESLRSYNFQDPCNCGNEKFCVIRVLRDHMETALTASIHSISPYYFLNNLNYFSPHFQRFRQEDVHEFLQALLDKLDTCCSDPRSDNLDIVEHVFGGRLVSELRCCNCKSVSKNFEHSLGLSIEIKDVDSLWSALDSFTRVEKLEEPFKCGNCCKQVSKEKQILLDKLPLVATIHLKRFENNEGFIEKIFNHVKFPLELDLKPYVSGGSEVSSTKYHLYAFVEHLGSLSNGHYCSYVRSAPKIWHKFDDMEVTRIDEESVLSKDPYILFYTRDDTPWFSRVFEEIQPRVMVKEESPVVELLNLFDPKDSCKSCPEPSEEKESSESCVALSDEFVALVMAQDSDVSDGSFLRQLEQEEGCNDESDSEESGFGFRVFMEKSSPCAIELDEEVSKIEFSPKRRKLCEI